MKQIAEFGRSKFIIPLIIANFLVVCWGIISCNSKKEIKFVPKLDSVQVVYKDSVQGPFLFVGLFRSTSTFVPTSKDTIVYLSDTSKKFDGKYIIDTVWALKIQMDTMKDPKAVHTYKYQPVNKKYIQIISTNK